MVHELIHLKARGTLNMLVSTAPWNINLATFSYLNKTTAPWNTNHASFSYLNKTTAARLVQFAFVAFTFKEKVV